MSLDEVKERVAKIKAIDGFTFNEEKHEYRLNGKKLQSVTGWIDRFKEPFDEKKWLDYKARQFGVANEDVKKGWDYLSDTALDLGHLVHKYIEEFLGGLNPKLPEDEKTRKRVEAWLKFYEAKLSQMTLIDQEFRVVSDKFGLAGTIDALFWWKDSIVVGDWKTNKKFKTDDDKHYRNLLYPFTEYPENTINKYSLQTSTYQALLEEHGIIAPYAFICWISPDAEVKMFPAKNFSKTIKTYLMAYPA